MLLIIIKLYLMILIIKIEPSGSIFYFKEILCDVKPLPA